MFVYADNAATTALSPTALRTMTAALQDVYGNPSSLHRMGRVAAAALKGARETMAKYLGAKARGDLFHRLRHRGGTTGPCALPPMPGPRRGKST